MSQARIVKVLEKLGESEWISTKQLAKILKINPGTVTTNLQKLRRYGEIESKRKELKGQSSEREHRLTSRGRKCL